MHISTKGRYGTRALLSLTKHFDEGPIPTSVIADEQGISRKYLECLMPPLKKAGLVSVQMGALGGYRLGREPGMINLYEVLDAMGESFDIVFCTGKEQVCDREATCATRLVWRELSETVKAVLRKTTLADLESNLDWLKQCQIGNR